MLPDDGSRPAATVDDLAVLRATHAAWRLLAATNAPLILALLDRAFVTAGERTVTESVLLDQLADLVEQSRGDDATVARRAARDYLGEWCGESAGWLRKYYPPGTDEPAYDITVAAEKALTWATGLLTTRSFVGTESRLLGVLDLLDQIVEGTQTDPAERIRVLEERRAAIDAQIERIRGGDVPTLEPVQLRDRYQTLAATARGLLSDFREVEDNFRSLDRETRERIAGWDGPRGALLDTVLGRHDAITGSDQGASFRAFYDFLMSPSTLDRFRRNLGAVAAMSELAGVDEGLPRIIRDWTAAADGVQRTVARLSSQLRRFLEEQAYADNRRIAALIRTIESAAIQVRDDQPTGVFALLDEPRADLALPMDRTLFSPPVVQEFDDPRAAPEPSEADLAGLADLFAGRRIDPDRVRSTVRSVLAAQGGQLTVAEVLDEAPLTEGLAELVTVVEVADAEGWLDVSGIDTDPAVETVAVTDPDTRQRLVVRLPRLLLRDASVRGGDDDW